MWPETTGLPSPTIFSRTVDHRPSQPSGKISDRVARDPGCVLEASLDGNYGLDLLQRVPASEHDASRAAESTGSGLGLSITKAIIERHGGTITVASQPGQTTFTVALPQSGA